MGLERILTLLKRKPKMRPIYVDGKIVGYDDGLPNSININRTSLIEGLIGRSSLKAPFDSLLPFGLVKVWRQDYFDTASAYADKAIAATYIQCVGVSTGGAYLRARDRLPPWIEGVGTYYYVEVAVARTTDDVHLVKCVAGSETQLGAEAVDLTAEGGDPKMISCSGTSIKVARNTAWPPSSWVYDPDASVPSGDIKISVTDSAIASGAFGLANVKSRYLPPSHWDGAAPKSYATFEGWTVRATAILRDPASVPPEPLAYFEMPITGSGKMPPEDQLPVTVWDSEEKKAMVDPYRVEMPQETAELKKPVPQHIQQKVEVLKRKGWSDEEIYAFMPEAFPVERINRLAVTWSALIPTDGKGKPKDSVALVRVFPSTPEYCHPIEKRIQAIKEMRGVRRLKREEAIDLALKMDDKLHIHDLVPCTKHEFGGKCFKEYRDWRIHTVGDKPEFADTDIRKRYVKEPKGW